MADIDSVLIPLSEKYLGWLVEAMGSVLFAPIYGVPAIVIWLAAGSIFFTLRLGFVNVRLFTHAVKVVSGKYDNKNDPGEVSHFAALSAAVSATVGLGNIAGVAVAVTLGGPGAVIWMMIMGLLGMSTKFAEVTMGHKYRQIDPETGKVTGGAFYYLRDGLKDKGLGKLGAFMAGFFALMCIGASLASGNMFQSNQSVAILSNTFETLNQVDWLIAFVLAFCVGVVLVGGIKRIAGVAAKVVPAMALIYITACVVVLYVNADGIGAAIETMFNSAFGLDAAGGGLIGAIINGVKRATFSNEAGIGSAPIAHAAAKTKEPVREGCVALLEPFIDTVIICFMTGLVITVTGVYQGQESPDGVLLTSAAFETVIGWFPIVLSVAVVLFAYSTMITWAYYGERSWRYLFGETSIRYYHILFITCTFIGGIINLVVVVDLSDLMLFAMAVPNLIGLYLLSGDISKDKDKYMKKMKIGKAKV